MRLYHYYHVIVALDPNDLHMSKKLSDNPTSRREDVSLPYLNAS